jgi:hypothetical protein
MAQEGAGIGPSVSRPHLTTSPQAPASDEKLKVFVSYSRRDATDFAARLVDKRLPAVRRARSSRRSTRPPSAASCHSRQATVRSLLSS